MPFLKNRKESNSVTFFCFTPAVSLTTFVIEFVLAFYVLFKYKSTAFSRLCVITLFCLGLFQLSEFLICKTPHIDLAIKIGYVSITLLPALGINIIGVVTGLGKYITYCAYVSAAFLIAAILWVPQVTFLASCNPNYVNIASNTIFSILHGLYYTIFIALGIGVLLYSISHRIKDKNIESWMIISYLVFVVPALTLFYFRIILHMALASVMCGFALITGLIYVFIILPRYNKLKKERK